MKNHDHYCRYLNLEQVSNILGGRSRSSIYRDVAAGRLPEPIRLGGRIYWREPEVHDALRRSNNEAAVDAHIARRCVEAA